MVLATAVARLRERAGGDDHAAAPSSTSTSAVPSRTPSSRCADAEKKSTGRVQTVPPVSAKARAAGLIDITIIPDAIIDLRYATADNFTNVRLYPIGARCLVHQSMARGLTIAASGFAGGYQIVFWDCYRPHSVQIRMFRIVPTGSGWPSPARTRTATRRSVG